MPDFSLENSINGIVVGIDEAGRGPLAGPVVAAAVVLDYDDYPQGLNDSKKLTAKKRQILFEQLYEKATIGVGISSVEEIDMLNILGATKLAMQKAYKDLKISGDLTVLIDGNQPPVLPCNVMPVIKGDSISLSIAAASIIAKVTRDKIMLNLAKQFPFYGWEKNSGYGTKLHMEAMEKHGVTSHHRQSFAPVKKYSI